MLGCPCRSPRGPSRFCVSGSLREEGLVHRVRLGSLLHQCGTAAGRFICVDHCCSPRRDCAGASVRAEAPAAARRFDALGEMVKFEALLLAVSRGTYWAMPSLSLRQSKTHKNLGVSLLMYIDILISIDSSAPIAASGVTSCRYCVTSCRVKRYLLPCHEGVPYATLLGVPVPCLWPVAWFFPRHFGWHPPLPLALLGSSCRGRLYRTC